MRRPSFGLALIALVAAGCGQGKGTGTAGSNPAKGVAGVYWIVQIGSKPVGGTITSDGGGFNCGTGGSVCGVKSFQWATTSVTLTATPDAGYTFRGWAGDCSGTAATCTFTRNDGALDFVAIAAFDGVGTLPPPPPPDTTPGQVWGILSDTNGGAPAGVAVDFGLGPDFVATTTDQGAFTMLVPPGVYSVAFSDPSGAYLPVTVSGVTVAPAGSVELSEVLTPDPAFVPNPLTVDTSASAPQLLAGFGRTVSLSCGVTGATGTKTYTWAQTAGPTIVPAATLASWGATGSFTTASFSEIVNAARGTDVDGNPCPGGYVQTFATPEGCGVSNLVLENRLGLVPLSFQQGVDLTYGFTCTVTDGVGATQAGTVGVQLASPVNGILGTRQPNSVVASQSVTVPVGLVVIANDMICEAFNTDGSCKTPVTSYAWALTPPPGSSAHLSGAGTQNPWFVPDVEGDYTLASTVAPATTPAARTLVVHAGDWTGAYVDSTTTPASTYGCAECHSPGPQYAKWAGSKHSTMLRTGMAGAPFDGGNEIYSADCVVCHSAGYDPAANNGGFLAVATSLGWSFPPLPTGATYDSLDPALKARGGVTCESCHGAGDVHANAAGTATAPIASLSSKSCASCHDGQPDDNIYSQWASMGHGDLTVATNEGLANNNHCLRCHTGQGFLAYVPALLAGNPDKLGNKGPLVVPAVSGLTAANVEAITCSTCHEPHSLGLRVQDGDTAVDVGDPNFASKGLLLPAGFRIRNAGAGALCASCHNSRNGMVYGSTTIAATAYQRVDGTPFVKDLFGGPHDAAQADIYFGGNGYLLNSTPQPAPANFHMSGGWFQDTCVECHVKRFPAGGDAWPTTSSNHTFAVDDGTCASCHGAGEQSIDNVKGIVDSGLAAWRARMVGLLNGAGLVSVTGLLNGAATAATYTVNTALNPIVSVGPTIDLPGGKVNRSLTIDIAFANGDTVTAIKLTDVLGTGSAQVLVKSTSTVFPAGTGTAQIEYGNFAKALYDSALIVNDGSHGVHNPPFVEAMLANMANLSLP